MKRLAPYFVAVVLAAQAIAAYAQASGKPEPGFTLTLSEGHRGSIVASYQVLVVKLTNISKEVMHRTMCDSFGGLYNLEVVYNGVPVEKTDAELKWRKQHETGMCAGSGRGENTKPGEDRYDTLYYNTTKPGTYEITVTRETFPGEPEKSVTVRSNTLTFVVPGPGAGAPQ
jgi:hypothetical protein